MFSSSLVFYILDASSTRIPTFPLWQSKMSRDAAKPPWEVGGGEQNCHGENHWSNIILRSNMMEPYFKEVFWLSRNFPTMSPQCDSRSGSIFFLFFNKNIYLCSLSLSNIRAIIGCRFLFLNFFTEIRMLFDLMKACNVRQLTAQKTQLEEKHLCFQLAECKYCDSIFFLFCSLLYFQHLEDILYIVSAQ